MSPPHFELSGMASSDYQQTQLVLFGRLPRACGRCKRFTFGSATLSALRSALPAPGPSYTRRAPPAPLPRGSRLAWRACYALAARAAVAQRPECEWLWVTATRKQSLQWPSTTSRRYTCSLAFSFYFVIDATINQC
jgi:hypothetical protein